jgi:hypothetical protein
MQDGCTALIHAAKAGHQDCCYVLLCYKCDVDYVDNREQSAMMKASRGVSQKHCGHTVVVTRAVWSSVAP